MDKPKNSNGITIDEDSSLIIQWSDERRNKFMDDMRETTSKMTSKQIRDQILKNQRPQ